MAEHGKIVGDWSEEYLRVYTPGEYLKETGSRLA